MLCVIAFHEGDRRQATEQAHWIRDLGGVKTHECLLVPAMNCDPAGVAEPLREAFGKVQVLPMWEQLTGWPRAANITWANIAQHISNPHPKALPAPQPWLWLEPDAVPLVPSWLDQLQAEYEACGKPLLGAEVDHTADGGRRYLSGVSIYPINTPFLCGEKILDLSDPQMNEAFDPYFRDEFLRNAHLSRLIQHVWVTSRNPDVLPTFPDAASLGQLWPEAVLFHRVKDGSLIKQLTKRTAHTPHFPRLAPAAEFSPNDTGEMVCEVPGGSDETVDIITLDAPPSQFAKETNWIARDLMSIRSRLSEIESRLFGGLMGRHYDRLVENDMNRRVKAKQARKDKCPQTNGQTAVSSVSPTALAKRRRGRSAKVKPQRSAEQQAADRARMARVRAAKKAKVSEP